MLFRDSAWNTLRSYVGWGCVSFLGWVILKIVLRAVARFLMGHASLEDIEQYSVENTQKVVCEMIMYKIYNVRGMSNVARASCASAYSLFPPSAHSALAPDPPLRTRTVTVFPTLSPTGQT